MIDSVMEPIVNRVAESEIEVFNLEALWDGRPVLSFDIAPFLEDGFLLREKEFREAVRSHEWSTYAGAHVAVFCSTDALIPTWAFMLVGTRLEGVAHSIAIGTPDELRRDFFVRALEAFDWSVYTDRIVVVKGCASRLVPANAYALATQKLQHVARKLMYGEPCSSVPLWRRPAAS